MCIVEDDGGKPAAVATMTPPRQLTISPAPPAAAEAREFSDRLERQPHGEARSINSKSTPNRQPRKPVRNEFEIFTRVRRY